MEITALWNSIAADVTRYALARLVRWRMAALWLLLVTAYLVAQSPARPVSGLAMPAAFLLLAIMTFRVWDDLADRGHDRLRLPQRTIVASRHLWPFILLVVTGLLLLAAMLRASPTLLVILAWFTVGMALLYHSGPGSQVSRPLRAGLVLAKYPLFVFLMVTPTYRAWLAGVSVLIVLAMYEWRDDESLRETSGPLFVAGIVAGAALIPILYLSTGALR
jgi:hypothetical protein